jgi:hypothetical protein
LGIARGTINIRPLRGRRLSAHQAAKPHNTVGPAPNDSRFLRFTKYQRSDSIGAPSPPGRLIGPSNQNVNRVVLRFMTKVFRSFLSKFRIRQASRPSVVLITKTNLSKALPERASVGRFRVPTWLSSLRPKSQTELSTLNAGDRVVYAPSKPVSDES